MKQLLCMVLTLALLLGMTPALAAEGDRTLLAADPGSDDYYKRSVVDIDADGDVLYIVADGQLMTYQIGDEAPKVLLSNLVTSRNMWELEKEAQKQVGQMLPASLRSAMMGYLDESALNEREHAILKAADKLSALIKCTEEARSGNTEFQSAERSTRAALAAMQLPELEIFLRDYLPAYCLTLDELMETAEPAAE